MYNIIRSALRKPISVVVAVMGLLFFSVMSLFTIPVDIFPNLDLPTIYVVQPYGGMAPDQMDGFIATRYQDHFLYVSGIRDIDVKTIQGLSLIKLSFYPGTDMAQAAAEVANNSRDGVLDVLARVDLARVDEQVPEDLLPAYVQLVAVDPAEEAAAPGAPQLVALGPPTWISARTRPTPCSG